MRIHPVGTFEVIRELTPGDLVFGQSREYGLIGWKVIAIGPNGTATARPHNWTDADVMPIRTVIVK